MSKFAGLKDFILIWIGQVISGVGSRFSSFALGIWVLQETASTTQFAFIFVAMAVPAILVAPFAGALIDRWDRRKVMLACDLLSAIVAGLLALLLANDMLSIWHIYIGVAVMAICTACHQAAYAASIPLLVDKEHLTRVNGAVQMSYAISLIAGPLLAGILVSVISIHGILLIDAITFVIGFVALLFVVIPKPIRSEAEQDSKLWQEAITGWKYVRERKGLVGLLTVFGVNNFFFGVASIAITPLILSFADPELLGVQFAIGGAGMLLSGMAVTTFGGPKNRVNGVLLFSVIAGLSIAIHGLYPSFILVSVFGFLLFATMPVMGASNDSLWQSKVPLDLQGRCFAIQRVLSQAAMPIGYAIAGPLMDLMFEPLLMPEGLLADSVGNLIGIGQGRGTALMFIVLGLLMTLVALIAYSKKSVRDIEELPDAVINEDTVSYQQEAEPVPQT